MGSPNWAHQTIWTGDCLDILRGMNSASVDLVYLDPPFNSDANYAAPIGSKAAGAAFKDTWSLSDVNVEWINLIESKHPALYRVLLAALNPSDKSYLVYMAARLLEIHRVLKPSGSVYMHCDPKMSHYLKLVMDAIFGRRKFKNEIIWKRTSSHNRAKRWGPVHDVILFYAGPEYTWNRTLQPLDEEYVENHYNHDDDRGRYQVDNLTGPGLRDSDTGMPWRGVDPGNSGRHWELPPDRALPDWFMFPEGYSQLPARKRLTVLDKQGLIYWPKRGTMPRFKRYLLPLSGQPIADVVVDIKPVATKSKERTHYPTQKPTPLLARIISSSSNLGDIVLDPFCGCATACIAAEKLHRHWVGIDISPKAADLVRQRMRDELGMYYEGAHRTDIPTRTDLGKLRRYNSQENRKRLYGEQSGNCAGCKDHFEARHLEVDHIIARLKGGTDATDNLQLLCGNCNRIKGHRGMDYLKAKLQLR